MDDEGGNIIETKQGRAKYIYKPHGEIGSDSNLNLRQIDVLKTSEETKTTLEYMIVLLSKNLKLKAKQSAGLLADGNKYLAHILVKGVKGQFEPIQEFFQEVYSSHKHLIKLIQMEESQGSVRTILQAFKPGLLSKNFEVAEWASRVLAKLGYGLADVDLLGTAWEWLSSGGL